jgi:DNA polymerase-3 subunit epsilon
MSASFTAIDFETATGYYHSVCAVGIVSVENGIIKDKYYSLVQPPDNYYSWRNIQVHGIRPEDTKDTPLFPGVFEEMREWIEGKIIVAHNEVFDRNVLQKTMQYYGLNYQNLNLSSRWECTCKLYRAKGYRPASLNACCHRLGIGLKHHEALSDAVACAELFLHHLRGERVY